MPASQLETNDTLGVDPVLLGAVVDAVGGAMAMCGLKARCVAVSRIPTHETGTITGMIGVHGTVSGFVTVHMAERLAQTTVGGLLQEEFASLTHQVIDGVGEITNIIAGGIKRGLGNTPWAFRDVTVPSVIIGKNYHIAFTRGLEYLSVTFEHASDELVLLDDRLIQVAVSLIRLN